jgi:hypothetical protein
MDRPAELSEIRPLLSNDIGFRDGNVGLRRRSTEFEPATRELQYLEGDLKLFRVFQPDRCLRSVIAAELSQVHVPRRCSKSPR